MDLARIRDYIDLESKSTTVCIIGCGSVGSWLAVMLAKCGVPNFRLYDFDTVQSYNVSNQYFTGEDVGKNKCAVIEEAIRKINPSANVRTCTEGWKPGSRLKGVVFLAVDSIDLRRQIVEDCKANTSITAFFDIRTSLESADIYCADNTNIESVNNFLNTMNYHDSDVTVATSACGGKLGLLPTVTTTVSLAVAEYINYIKTGKLKKYIGCYPFQSCSEGF